MVLIPPLSKPINERSVSVFLSNFAYVQHNYKFRTLRVGKRTVPRALDVSQQAITSISARSDLDGLPSVQQSLNVFVRLVCQLQGQTKAVELVVLTLPFAHQRCQP